MRPSGIGSEKRKKVYAPDFARWELGWTFLDVPFPFAGTHS
jgi:hypothetical protein